MHLSTFLAPTLDPELLLYFCSLTFWVFFPPINVLILNIPSEEDEIKLLRM